jgi:hypothetical protein
MHTAGGSTQDWVRKSAGWRLGVCFSGRGCGCGRACHVVVSGPGTNEVRREILKNSACEKYLGRSDRDLFEEVAVGDK